MSNFVSMVILKGNRPSSPNTFELLVLLLTPSICLGSERWNFSILLKLCWSLESPQLSQAMACLIVVSIRFRYMLTDFPSDFYKNRWSLNNEFFTLFIKFSIPQCFLPDAMNVNPKYIMFHYFDFLPLKVKSKFPYSCSLFVKNHYFCFAQK